MRLGTSKRFVAFIPSFEPLIARALALADMREGEELYDLGSGDGRVLLLAAREFGARATGIELSKDLVRVSRRKVAEAGLSYRVRIVHGDIRRVPLGDADVVFMFLSPVAHAQLAPKLERELRAGARIVTHSFSVPGWNPEKQIVSTGTPIYLFLRA
jgi:cyclopropane fatty-acyl-phospholipid synthase-like methyltransferase